LDSSENNLTRLSQELIDAIIQSLDDQSKVSLALTAGYFFRLLAPAVCKIVITGEAPWANDRLAVVGDYAASFPLGIEHYPTTTITPGQLCSIWYSQINQAEVQLLYRLLCYLGRSRVRESTEAVLRNLDQGEYVRDSALADSEYAYSLGEVICILTQFTDDSSGTEGLDLVGDWVADRFDIATIDDVDEEWTDVSQCAISLLAMATGEKKKDGKRAGTCSRKL
jgi:hypothetical protein